MELSKKYVEDLKKENIATSKMDQPAENWLDCLKHYCIFGDKEFRKLSKNFIHEAKISDTLNRVTKYLLSHPFLLVGFILLAAIIITPIFLFTTFAIINVAIAFSAFIIIEVLLLMIGITVFCCLMGFIITAILMTGLTFLISSYIVYFSISLVKKKLNCK